MNNQFDVDIDFSDKIHLIYYNQTAETFVYQIVSVINLVKIAEFEVACFEICLDEIKEVFGK